ncbi:MAG: zeta toxin family protein [Cyclobacteriaceae bacterium]|nr:zeta toxin family protein [Cyclobacteriaceae bacterium]
MPNLYIIGGCNGAGKTTASFTVLPEILNCKEFVNADEIARGISPFQPETVAFEAGRFMLTRIDELMEKGIDFAFETTLATRSYSSTIQKAKDIGYFISLVYFWLDSSELAISRVKERVASGGHNIPEHVVKRRYVRGLLNLFDLYIPSVDFWIAVDNSSKEFLILADGGSQGIKTHNASRWSELEQNYKTWKIK